MRNRDMKKKYLKPFSVVYSMECTEGQLLSESQSARNIGGGPTGEGMPGTVGETDGDTDPYGGHGQGNGGGGSRGKDDSDPWDEVDDEE